MTLDHAPPDDGPMRADLQALNPDLDPHAEARFAAAVAARMDARLASSGRSQTLVPIDPLYGLWSLPRPLLVAASIIAMVAVGIASRAGPAGAPATIAQSIGVPTQLLSPGAQR